MKVKLTYSVDAEFELPDFPPKIAANTVLQSFVLDLSATRTSATLSVSDPKITVSNETTTWTFRREHL